MTIAINKCTENINTCLPNEMLVNIFRALPMNNQLNCRLVCKKWDELAEQAKNIEAILGYQVWAQLGIWIPDRTPIPEAAKKFIKGVKARDRMIVLIPKGISEEKVGALMKNKFPQNADGYEFVPNNIKILEEYKQVIEKCYWIGLTRTLIKEHDESKQDTRNEGKQLTYQEANEYVKKFQNDGTFLCRLPKRLEISCASLLKFEQTGERLLKRDSKEDKWNMSWCEEKVKCNNQQWGTAVGNFQSHGFAIYDLYNITGIDLWGKHITPDRLGLIPVHEFQDKEKI